MTLKIGCIGSGGIAAAHLTNMSKLPDVELVGVSGRNLERADALARRFGTTAHADPIAMLDAARPDALLICVTPDAHGAYERAAIERKIPFLVEKPLAADWETAAAIARELERSNVIASVGYHWRYNTSVERARDLIAGKRVGLAQGYWESTTPPPAWWSRLDSSGGQMVEQTTHIFDTARLLLGEPVWVCARAARVPQETHPNCNVDEVSTATVEFASGTIATFNSACIATPGYRIGLELVTPGFVVEVTADAIVADSGTEKSSYRGLGNPESIAREGRAFVDAVRTGDPGSIRSSYVDAMRTHRLTTLARESARLGQPLEIPATAF